MARVLISFLGTGPFENIAERKYKNATYRIDGVEYETPFVSAALSMHLNIDRRIVIGTAKSMWEEYYKLFCLKYDQEFYQKIVEYTVESGYQTQDFEPLKELEGKLGNTSIIAIKYGLNEHELRENISKVLEIDNLLQKDDELYIDITHGFRSFPLLAQQVLFYLREVSPKNIRPEKFYYGMLDASREIGYTPVIDLGIMLEMNEWILGANQFITTTNGDTIIKLIETKDTELANLLNEFSKAMSVNYSFEIKNQLEKLADFDINRIDNPEKLIVEKVVGEFISHFTKKSCQSLFQYELSLWFYNKKNYSNAYTVLSEAIISLVCEKNGKNPMDQEQRQKAKETIYRNKELYKIYKPINQIRNNIAHNLNGRPNKYLNDIDDFPKYSTLLKKYFLKYRK